MKSRGAVLIFVLFAIVPLIWLIGLIVDLGRYFIVVRQLQNAADSAALAGVYMLRSCDPSTNSCTTPYHIRSCGTAYSASAPNLTIMDTPYTYKECGEKLQSRGGFIAVKPAAAEMISRHHFLNADMSGFASIAWEDGLPTNFDSNNWRFTRYSPDDPNSPTNNLEVALNRWHQCIDVPDQDAPALALDICGAENPNAVVPLKKYIGVDYDDPYADSVHGGKGLVEVRTNIDGRVNPDGWILEDDHSDTFGGECHPTRPTDDSNKSTYCVANAVTVSVGYPNGLPFFWVRLFFPGFTKTRPIRRDATAVMRHPWCNGLPKCSEFRRHVADRDPPCPIPPADGSCNLNSDFPECDGPNVLPLVMPTVQPTIVDTATPEPTASPTSAPTGTITPVATATPTPDSVSTSGQVATPIGGT